MGQSGLCQNRGGHACVHILSPSRPLAREIHASGSKIPQRSIGLRDILGNARGNASCVAASHAHHWCSTRKQLRQAVRHTTQGVPLHEPSLVHALAMFAQDIHSPHAAERGPVALCAQGIAILRATLHIQACLRTRSRETRRKRKESLDELRLYNEVRVPMGLALCQVLVRIWHGTEFCIMPPPEFSW